MKSLYPSMLAMALQRGWLTPLAAKRVESLIAEGLHPEQVLVGTGLLSRDRYAECLSEASGLPFVDAVDALPWDGVVSDKAVLELLKRAKMLLFQKEEKQLTVGSANPEFEVVEAARQALADLSFELNAFCIFEAEWRRANPVSMSRQSFAETIHRLMRLIQQTTGDVFTVFESGEGVHAHEAAYPSEKQGVLVARLPWIRVSSMLERRLPRIGWVVEERVPYAPRALVLRRVTVGSQAHPMDWPSRIQEFLRKPMGVLVFVDGDAELRRKFRFPFEQAVSDKAGHQAQDTIWIEAEHAPEREQALQFAIMGKPMVIFTKRLQWLNPLRELRIPLSIVHAHLTPQGRAWQISHE